VALEVNDVHTLLDLVDENLGVAVVPRHFAHKRASLTALPVKGTGEAVYETVALLPPRQATSPAARALMALLEASGTSTGSTGRSTGSTGTSPGATGGPPGSNSAAPGTVSASPGATGMTPEAMST
jgi:hypothetical protein